MALYLDGQNIISGGGGSGGHTIVDAEGVSLEQRTNLQFKGAYSEDNSTDDTTEVNVVRSMTKAEFNLLSADEKVGFINITDESDAAPLADLPDVNLTSPTDGQVLKYDSTNQEWINANESSDGHTIVDEDGTSLTQRTNLQFNGTYLEDNSIDDTTEINVVREMTKAEFDLLSDYEKIGIINITDITSSNMGFQPVIYSEDEREIGVFTDGKPLYQKTLHLVLTSPIEPQTATAVQLTGLTASDIDFYRFVSVNGGYYGTQNYISTWLILNFESNDTGAEAKSIRGWSKGQITIWMGSNYGNFPQVSTDNRIRELYITVQYTKTTDAAGSGTWTPQGVPAHHYSTSEHVVGTWVDGSTLYEKTTIFLNQQLQGGDTYLSLGISNLAIVVDSSALITNSDHTNIRPMNSWHLDSASSQMWYRIILGSGELMIHTEGTWTSPNIYITIRYTKSSS